MGSDTNNGTQLLEREREVVNRLVCIYVSLLRKHLRELKDISEVLCNAKNENNCDDKFKYIGSFIEMINGMEKALC
jgi:hypothetical protein